MIMVCKGLMVESSDNSIMETEMIITLSMTVSVNNNPPGI